MTPPQPDTRNGLTRSVRKTFAIFPLAGLLLFDKSHAVTPPPPPPPAVQPAPQPASQPMAQPMLQPAPQPRLQPMSQTGARPEAQPLVQPGQPPQPQPGQTPNQRPDQPPPPGANAPQPPAPPGSPTATERNRQGDRTPPPTSNRKAEPGNGDKSSKPAIDPTRMARLVAIDTARREFRTELFKGALNILKTNAKVADVAECGAGGSDVCVPNAAAIARIQASIIQPREIGRRVAFLIGNNNYSGNIPALETPQGDVEAIGKLLKEKLDYNVRIVTNASKADIIRTFQLAAKTTAQSQSVMVMYAGHGYQVKETGQGYWIPVDSTHNDPKGWVSNSDISKLLAAIPAKQIMLISDSCFSGTLTKEQKQSSDTNTPRQEVLGRRSVLALTSGGEEPVSDEGRDGHSVFAATLIDQLNEIKAPTTVSRLFEKVRDEVSREYPQEPQLGAVISAGHAAGGDYLIEPR